MASVTMRRVFISSTFVDLTEHRTTIRDVVRQLGALDVCMETFGARDERPVDECRRIVEKETDVFVGVYAHRYGYVPLKEKRSITEIEYEAAARAGWSCFVYLVDEKIPWVPEHVDEGAKKKRLKAFKKRLMASHVCKSFSNKDQLAAFVAADLGREFARRELPKVSDPNSTLIHRSGESVDWIGWRTEIMRSNRNVFLVHTVEPSERRGQEYDIAIFLAAHHGSDPRYRRADLSDVAYVEFFLGAHWRNRIFRVENSGGLIGLSTAAYGAFLCIAKVTFNDGESRILQRYIDFSMGPAARECRELRELNKR